MRLRHCPNCKQDISKSGHFVSPGMGDPGFFACESILKAEADQKRKAEELANTVVVESYKNLGAKHQYYYHKKCFNLSTVLDQNRVAEVRGTVQFEAFEKDEFDGEQHECFVCEASI